MHAMGDQLITHAMGDVTTHAMGQGHILDRWGAAQVHTNSSPLQASDKDPHFLPSN